MSPVASWGFLGSVAIGFANSPLAHAGAGHGEESPLRLKISTSLSLPSPPSTPNNGLDPTAQEVVLAVPTGPGEPAPFRLRWSEAIAVAQSENPLKRAAPGLPGVPVGNTRVPLPPSPPIPAPAPAAPQPVPQPGGRSESGSKYGLAPIRWGGDISYGYNSHKSDDSESSANHIYQIRANARSYIIQPWLARISGDLSLALIQSSSSGEAAQSTGNTSITGGLGLNLFPLSRFPFSADFSVADTRTSGSFVSSDYMSYRLNLRQDYRPAKGRWRANGAFAASMLDGEFGTDTVYQLTGSYAWGGEDQTVDVHSSLARNSVSEGSNSDTFVTVANHNYRYSEAWRFDTNGTLAVIDLGNSTTGVSSNSNKILQLYTIGTWTPQDSRWRGSGTVRMSHVGSETSAFSSSSTNVAANAAIGFRANQNLDITGSASVSGSPGSNSGSIISTQTVGASYTGDPRIFGSTSYNWSTGTSFSNTSAGEINARSITASVNHSLSHYWTLGERTTLAGSVSQGALVYRSTGLDTLGGHNLSHSGSLSLSANPTDATLGMIGVSVSDSRSFGDAPNTFQSLSLQVGGDWRLSTQSSISGNLTWQKSKQSSEQLIDPLTGLPLLTASDDATINGAISYIHTRAFGVRGLSYVLQFAATSFQGNQREFGDPDATREATTRSVDQRLNYRIGRLDTQLQFRTAEVDGRKNALLFFRVGRSFGAF